MPDALRDAGGIAEGPDTPDVATECPPYPDFLRRSLGWVLDYIVISLIVLELNNAMLWWLVRNGDRLPGDTWQQQLKVLFYPNAFWSLVGFAYFCLMHALFGRSIGKWVLSMKIVDRRNLRVGRETSFLRAIASHGIPALLLVVSIRVNACFGIYLIFVLVNFWCLMRSPFHQALHDRIAGTVVLMSTQKPLVR